MTNSSDSQRVQSDCTVPSTAAKGQQIPPHPQGWGLCAPSVAMICEGGGMRNSYTAPVIDQLIAHHVTFGWVGGISAGASHIVNFLSHDRTRARESFVEFGANPKAGGLNTVLRGKGYFDAEYIYQEASAPDAEFPLDYQAFVDNPTPFRIGTVRADTGETRYFGPDDLDSLDELLLAVRASSTVPGFMVMPHIDGAPYVDGALGTSGGVPVDAAEADGFSRFLIIRTRPRGFRRQPPSSPQVLRQFFHNYPEVAELLNTRHERYNQMADYIEELEQQGKAYVFYPDEMPVTNYERSLSKLKGSYYDGLSQIYRDWDSVVDFLESSS